MFSADLLNSFKIPLNVTHWTYTLQVQILVSFCFLRIASPGDIMFRILGKNRAFAKYFSFLWFDMSTLREKHDMRQVYKQPNILQSSADLKLKYFVMPKPQGTFSFSEKYFLLWEA